MRITELLTKETIKLDVQATSKNDVIPELVEVLDKAGKLNDKEEYTRALFVREQQSTTGIGDGIAIPHAKTNAVKFPAIVFGRSKNGVEYEALDGQPSYLFFMIAASEGASNTHLEALSKLSSILMKQEAREQLLLVNSAEAVLAIIDQYDEKDEEVEEVGEVEIAGKSSGKILAVTACPTGIAHTYMAADALKEKAKELNLAIKG